MEHPTASIVDLAAVIRDLPGTREDITRAVGQRFHALNRSFDVDAFVSSCRPEYREFWVQGSVHENGADLDHPTDGFIVCPWCFEPNTVVEVDAALRDNRIDLAPSTDGDLCAWGGLGVGTYEHDHYECADYNGGCGREVIAPEWFDIEDHC